MTLRKTADTRFIGRFAQNILGWLWGSGETWPQPEKRGLRGFFGD